MLLSSPDIPEALFLLVLDNLDEFDAYKLHHNMCLEYDNPRVLSLCLLKDPARFRKLLLQQPDFENNEDCIGMGYLLCPPRDFLRGVPSKHLTDAVVYAILDRQPNAVQWLALYHPERITRERALRLVERANPPQGSTDTRFRLCIAKYLPEVLLHDQSFWDESFAINQLYFRHIPDEHKTTDMCIRIVQAYAFNFSLVPIDKRTTEIMRIAINAVTEDQLTAWQNYYGVKIKDSELLPLINSSLNRETFGGIENQPARRPPTCTELTHKDRLWTFIFLGFRIHEPFGDPQRPADRLISALNTGKS